MPAPGYGLRILILDNHDDGAALAEYLATFPGIEAIAVEDSLHHGWGEIQEGHPDVIIVDPFYEEIRESDGFANYDRLEPNRLDRLKHRLAEGLGLDQEFKYGESFIWDVRKRHPDIVLVLHTRGEELQSAPDFFEGRRSRLTHYILLDKTATGQKKQDAVDHALQRCREWFQVHPTRKQSRIFEYDVALSFAGDDRIHAEALAQCLTARGIKVFYDRYQQAELWGKDLYDHLSDVYSRMAEFCVIFASKAYADRVWTSLERAAAQERALNEKGQEYILPIRVDDTRIPGLRRTIAYINIDAGIPQICGLIAAKLGLRSLRMLSYLHRRARSQP